MLGKHFQLDGCNACSENGTDFSGLWDYISRLQTTLMRGVILVSSVCYKVTSNEIRWGAELCITFSPTVTIIYNNNLQYQP